MINRIIGAIKGELEISHQSLSVMTMEAQSRIAKKAETDAKIWEKMRPLLSDFSDPVIYAMFESVTLRLRTNKSHVQESSLDNMLLDIEDYLVIHLMVKMEARPAYIYKHASQHRAFAKAAAQMGNAHEVFYLIKEDRNFMLACQMVKAISKLDSFNGYSLNSLSDLSFVFKQKNLPHFLIKKQRTPNGLVEVRLTRSQIYEVAKKAESALADIAKKIACSNEIRDLHKSRISLE